MSEIVKVEEAVRHYRRGAEEVQAIDGVDLSVSQGDYLAVVGRSGSGKTTLLNLMGCVDKPTSGRVTVHGMETEELSERALATIRSTTIGFVFQQFYLIPTLTAIENVMVPGMFGARRNGDLRTRARMLLDRVGLAERADHLPNQLSGGEMQRVALARALINQPAILLADEPTGNLDTRSADEIATLFEEMNAEGLTIIVATHSAELAGNATRLVRLLDGRIVEDQRLRPISVPERETESRPGDLEESPGVEPEPLEAPEYMPASLKKRKWGSPAASASMVLLGVAMFAASFLPFVSGFNGSSGYRLLDRGLLLARFVAENSTRLYSGKFTRLFTGLWPMALGLLLIAAGCFFLFNRKRIGAWTAVAAGALCAIVSAADIILIRSRLSPDASVGYGLWILLIAGAAAVGLGVSLLIYMKRGRVAMTQVDEYQSADE